MVSEDINRPTGEASAPSGQGPPLLRWAGSKKRQYSYLKEFFPASFNEYVEPFAGSAAFLFRLQPNSAKINDVNLDLCSFYRHARHRPKAFYDAFIRIKRDRQTYYHVREKFNSLKPNFEKSVLFYFLACTRFRRHALKLTRSAFRTP